MWCSSVHGVDKKGTRSGWPRTDESNRQLSISSEEKGLDVPFSNTDAYYTSLWEARFQSSHGNGCVLLGHGRASRILEPSMRLKLCRRIRDHPSY
jgi:hypothetical protein